MDKQLKELAEWLHCSAEEALRYAVANTWIMMLKVRGLEEVRPDGLKEGENAGKAHI